MFVEMQFNTEFQQLFREGYGGVCIDLPRLASRVSIFDDDLGVLLRNVFDEEPPVETEAKRATDPPGHKSETSNRVELIITTLAELLEGESHAAEIFAKLEAVSNTSKDRHGQVSRSVSPFNLRSVLELDLGQYSKTSQILKWVQQNVILIPLHYLRLTYPILGQVEYLVKDVRRPDGWRITMHFQHSDSPNKDKETAYEAISRPSSVTVTHSRREQSINADKYFELEWSISVHLALFYPDKLQRVTNKRWSTGSVSSKRTGTESTFNKRASTGSTSLIESSSETHQEQPIEVMLIGHNLVIERVTLNCEMADETQNFLRREFVSKGLVEVREVVAVPAAELVDKPPARPEIVERDNRNHRKCGFSWFNCNKQKR